MSKKIWRGYAYHTHHSVCDSENTIHNATVVPDSACFPVKEARALCYAITDWYSVDSASYRLDEAQRIMGIAHEKYMKACERMAKKAKS